MEQKSVVCEICDRVLDEPEYYDIWDAFCRDCERFLCRNCADWETPEGGDDYVCWQCFNDRKEEKQ